MKRSRSLSWGLALALVFNMTLFASPVKAEDYFGNSYSVAEMDFEGNDVYDWAEIIDGTSFSKNAAKIKKDVNFIDQDYAGAMYFEFDFIADTISERFSAIMGEKDRDFIRVSAAESNGSIVLKVNGNNAGNVLTGEKVYVKMKADPAAGTAWVLIKTNSTSLYENSFNLESNNGIISKVGFEADSGNNVYIDNINIKREKRATNAKPVITRQGNYFNAEAVTNIGDFLYFVQYRQDKIVNVMTRECRFNYTELCMEDNSLQGDVFKVFVWNENLTPSMLARVSDMENLNSATLALNGSVTTGKYSEGENIIFSISLPSGYSEYQIVISDEKGVCSELTQQNNWVCQKSGDYTAWLYAKADGRLIPCAKCDFFVYPYLSSDDTFLFPAERDYYVHNGECLYFTEDGYIPLLLNDNLYLSDDMIRKVIGVEISDGKASYKGSEIISDISSVTQMDGIYSFGSVAESLGYRTEIKGDILCVTKKSAVTDAEYDAAIYDSIVKDSMDGNVKAWNNLYYPDNWGFYDWSSTADLEFGASFDDKTDGTNSVYISAVKKQNTSYAAYTYQISDFDVKAHLYAVSFDVKYSDDSAGNIPIAGLSFYNGSTFMGNLLGTAVSGKSNEWTRVTSYFTRESLDKYSGFTDLRLLIGARATESSTAGKIYFDNVIFRPVSILSGSTEAEIACEAFGAWHELGETVTYKPKDNKMSGFDKIYGVVYNHNDEAVYEKTVSVRDFYENGWQYTPDMPGYFEAEFYGVQRDGTRSLAVTCYTTNSGESYTVYNLARRSFAVVNGEAKQMQDRSDFLLLSDSGRDKDKLRLANIVGFSGVRIHGIFWGSTASNKGFEPSKGTFDWTNADEQINNVREIGFKNIIANVFATPTWAVNNGEENSYNSVGWYYKNCYKADNNSDIANAYAAFTRRYKDKINGIEVWNEPHYGKTAFWRDTPDNFAQLAKTAYDAIKSEAADMTVYSAGFNQAQALFTELMEKEEFRNAFDALSFHGRYEEDTEYRRVLEEYRMENVPLINSEGYYYSHYSKGVPKDFRKNNMYMYMCYFDHLKNNVDMAGLFEITENTLDEKRVNNLTGHTMGLFRSYPYYEPRQGAVAAYNLFKNLGKNVSFEGEYDFGSGRKAVAVKNDNELQVYLWNANDEDFAMPEQLEECMSANSSISDIYGNTADVRELKKLNVYCIHNVSEKALKNINTTDGTSLNTNYESPFYTCRNVYGETIEDYTPAAGVFTEGQLFSLGNFQEVDTAHFNSDNIVWNPTQNADCNNIMKFALSAADDGIYMIVKVKDSSRYVSATRADSIMNYDGLRIGIDCYGRVRLGEQTEFYVGYVNGRATLYKYNAADMYQAVSDGCSPSKTVLSGNYVNISYSSNEFTYKIYLPYSELYPFIYRPHNKKNIRINIAASDNDLGVKKGELCFGEGFAGDVQRVWKYGILGEEGHLAGIDMYSEDGMLYINGTPWNKSVYISMLVRQGNNIIDLAQVSHAKNSYSKRFHVTPNLKYTVTVTDNNRNTYTKTILAK